MWIKVEDRLPDDEQDIIMAWDDRIAMVGKFFAESMGFSVKKKRYYVGKIGVTHWKPLILPKANHPAGSD